MSNLIQLRFQPGVIRDETKYANIDGWYDCNWVRFRMGMPEKMGGWQQQIAKAFLGKCRSLWGWALLNGQQELGIGTDLKFYVCNYSDYTDVTPIRRTVTLGADPFASTVGSTLLTVTDVANGCTLHDFVTYSGATGFDVYSPGELNQEFEIVNIIDANTYQIDTGIVAASTTSGGGAAVSAAYQINVGLNTTVLGLGWGAGTWGHDTWGSDASSGTIPLISLRIWWQSNFGQNLITNVMDGGIYYWDATVPTDRMLALNTLVGESDAPVVAHCIGVSAQENHVVAFGCNPLGSSTQDPMFVRWSDTQSVLDWTPTVTNSAGGYRLSSGSRIVTALQTKTEFLVFTDTSLYTMSWVGFPYVFDFQLAGLNFGIIAPNAAVSSGDVTYWMGREQFYLYNGRIVAIPCTVSDYVFRRLNYQQVNKIYAFSNSMFSEVGWLYPSINGDENDSYVIYNDKEKAWYFGDLDRTAWLDRGGNYAPIATSPDGFLYNHETGTDDGSTNPPSPIHAYIQSSPIEAPQDGSGEHFVFIDKLIPDVTFRNSTAASPSVRMSVAVRNYPGADRSQTDPSSIVRTTTVPVEEFTNLCYLRLRGRSASFRCSSNTVGVTWRLGTPRIQYRLDGRR